MYSILVLIATHRKTSVPYWKLVSHAELALCNNLAIAIHMYIRASVDALCRDDTGQISHDPGKKTNARTPSQAFQN